MTAVISNHGPDRRRGVERRRVLLPDGLRRVLLDRLLLLRPLDPLRLLVGDLRMVLRLAIAQMFSLSLCIIPWSGENATANQRWKFAFSRRSWYNSFTLGG
jgi:hypothetical protein